MPIVKCPNCGRERLVVEGKKKKCRKCGTPLTANMGYSASEGPPDPLAAETTSATQVNDTVDDTVDSNVDDTVGETTEEAIAAQDEMELAALDRKQLFAKAKELGIKIPFATRNKVICELIKDKLTSA